MKRLIALALLPITLSAQAREWYPVATSRTANFDLLRGSLERTATLQSGTPVVAGTFRTRSKSNSNIDLSRKYVEVEDCQNQQGSIITVSMQGNPQYSADFVFGGGNIASILAEVICEVAFPSQGLRRQRDTML